MRPRSAFYWFYFAGGVVMPASFIVPGGAANNGWTSYAPLCDLTTGHGHGSRKKRGF